MKLKSLVKKAFPRGTTTNVDQSTNDPIDSNSDYRSRENVPFVPQQDSLPNNRIPSGLSGHMTKNNLEKTLKDIHPEFTDEQIKNLVEEYQKMNQLFGQSYLSN